MGGEDAPHRTLRAASRALLWRSRPLLRARQIQQSCKGKQVDETFDYEARKEKSSWPLFFLPVNDDAINEADNAGQHLNLQLGDKERRGINIDPHELGIEVLLDKTLNKKRW